MKRLVTQLPATSAYITVPNMNMQTVKQERNISVNEHAGRAGTSLWEQQQLQGLDNLFYRLTAAQGLYIIMY